MTYTTKTETCIGFTLMQVSVIFQADFSRMESIVLCVNLKV